MNGTALVLETQYPMKTVRQKETTDRSKAKAVTASHEPEEDTREMDGPVTDAASNVNQLQLAE